MNYFRRSTTYQKLNELGVGSKVLWLWRKMKCIYICDNGTKFRCYQCVKAGPFTLASLNLGVVMRTVPARESFR